MDEPHDARLTVAAVAHRLGVAPATLRTWDRRYGLGPGGHTAGAHRRYSADDVVRLQTMRRLIMSGVPPGEAARVARGQPSASPGPAAPLPGFDGRLAGGGGGPVGQVLALAGADAAVRGLGRAAMALDSESVTEMLREQVARHGVLHTWDHVLRPVLVAVGARWAATGEGVEVEHSLSDCAAVVLRAVGDGVLCPPGRRPVLLACAPDEQHALPLHALGAALAERGIATRTLGAALPAAALEAALRRTGAGALFLWSCLPGTADEQVLADLPMTRPATVLLVGGPGWAVERLPSRVTVAVDLAHAVALVEQALGA
ncbi:MAG: MerR family transcriptional regulator [Actinobacteria bacterium]|nr:MerR family transcriptional regulator [Actinomycetota bacterium]